MTRPPLPDLPVKEIFGELKNALGRAQTVILEAPPGAGKTTLVPLGLLSEDWLGKRKIVMLEPRRLAARLAAKRMADLLGEKVGETVGYHIRQDRKTGPKTRIEVVTEGILTRRLQNTPDLPDTALVIFDEFHERNLQGDLGLAFCLESQEALRDDLRLVIMSATLNAERLLEFLPEAECIKSRGQSHPVGVQYFPRPERHRLVGAMVQVIEKAYQDETGNILAFLPGASEIHRVQGLLKQSAKIDPTTLIAPLYGALSWKMQDQAILPTPEGVRKIVLATNIAETSLTIEGINIVVDSGLRRAVRFDHARSLSQMETRRISLSSATQRMGRAGRLGPGQCYRLWPEAETRAMIEDDPAEILEADLMPVALELAGWGARSFDGLRLADKPHGDTLKNAQSLLRALGALDDTLGLSPHGQDILSLSLHPRLAHMCLIAQKTSRSDGTLACLLAALVQDGPLTKDRDLLKDLSAFLDNTATNKAALSKIRQTFQGLCKRLGLETKTELDIHAAPRWLALAYPDRIAQARQQAPGSFLLSHGPAGELPEDDPLGTHDFLVVADINMMGTTGRIFKACALLKEDLTSLFRDRIEEVEDVQFDPTSETVRGHRITRYGRLTLDKKPLSTISRDAVDQALCKALRADDLKSLVVTHEARTFCQRVEFLRLNNSKCANWPDMSHEGLKADLEDWLVPFLGSVKGFFDLKKINLLDALKARLSWQDQQFLDQKAPETIRVPSGSNIKIDYRTPEKPVLAVKLQEMFGQTETPTINEGQTRLQIHLLSPARRPLQVTEDLQTFWQNAYDSVKKEMKGRYPKHPWPDDPLNAIATQKTTKKMGL